MKELLKINKNNLETVQGISEILKENNLYLIIWIQYFEKEPDTQ